MRSTIQPLRRCSYPRHRSDLLVLDLKFENNFADSSYYDQKVTAHNPDVVSVATQRINYPGFDQSTISPWSSFINTSQGVGGVPHRVSHASSSKYSAAFGVQPSSPMLALAADTHGRFIQSNGKDWKGNEDKSPNGGDPLWDKTVLMVRANQGLYGTDSFASETYKNKAEPVIEDYSKPVLDLDGLKSFYFPPNRHSPDGVGKFDDSFFSFGSNEWQRDKNLLLYKGSSSFDFSDSDFTVEFWAKPKNLESLPNDPRTNLPRYKVTDWPSRDLIKFYADSIILSTACFVIGWSYYHGFFASVPNGQASTNVDDPDITLMTSDGAILGNTIHEQWNHVSFCKSGADLFLFVNGVLVSTNNPGYSTSWSSDPPLSSANWDGTIDTTLLGFSTSDLSVGLDMSGQNEGPNEDSDGVRYSYGYVGGFDELRITKGACRYSTNPTSLADQTYDKYNNFTVLKVLSPDGLSLPNTTLTDSSPKARTIQPFTSTSLSPWSAYWPKIAAHSDTTAAYGSTSIYFDHNNFHYSSTNYPCVGTPRGTPQAEAEISAGTWDGDSDDWDWINEDGSVKDFTIEFWFNPSEDQGSNIPVSGLGGRTGVLISKSDTVYTFYNDLIDQCEWIIGFRNKKIGFAYRPLGSKKIQWMWGSASANINSWTHVGVQMNSANGNRLELYINGTLETQSAANVKWATPNYKANVKIGALGSLGYSMGYHDEWAGFKGYIEDVRITTGIARYAPHNALPNTRHPLYSNEDVREEVYYDLHGEEQFLIKAHDENDTSKFKDITNDQTAGYDNCRVGCEGAVQYFPDSRYRWSAKNQSASRIYANNDFLVYAGFRNQYQQSNLIRFLSIKRNLDGTRSCSCDAFHDLVITGSQSMTEQLLYDGKYIYHFHGIGGGKVYLVAYRISQHERDDGKIVYIPTEASKNLIEDPSGYNNSGYTDYTYTRKHNHCYSWLINHYPVTQVAKTTVRQNNTTLDVTNIYVWCSVTDGTAAYNYGLGGFDVQNTYENTPVGSYHFQHFQFIHEEDGDITFNPNTALNYSDKNPASYRGEKESGAFPSVYDSKYHQTNTIGRSHDQYSSTDAYTFPGKNQNDETEYIFVLEKVYTDKTKKTIEGLALHGYSIGLNGELIMIGVGEKAEVVLPSTVSVHNVFYHNGYLYAGDSAGSGKTYVYKVSYLGAAACFAAPCPVSEDGINILKTSSELIAGYGAGDYIFGKSTSDSQDYIYYSYNPRSFAPLTENPQAILVSGSGVYSNGPEEDSAQELNLNGDFTIEGWAKFRDIPQGTDDEPGMTLFDFGNVKLTNTSGFFTVETIDSVVDEVNLMDYYDPNFLDSTHEDYLPNRFIHFAVQRRAQDLELWLGHASVKGDESLLGESHMKLVMETSAGSPNWDTNSFLSSDVTGHKDLPYNSARAIGSTITGTNFFTGYMENFRVWKEAIYGPQNLRVGGPYADGIFTDRDGQPAIFKYYYYKHLRTFRSNNRYYNNVINYVNTVPIYEGSSIVLFCTAQSYYDPRYSLNSPMPITIEWYKTNNPNIPIYSPALSQYAYGSSLIGSSSSGGRQFIFPNYILNYHREGELWIRGVTFDNGGLYTAVVKIGDPARPKYLYSFKNHLVGVNLWVQQNPVPPPPPKATFSLYSCNTCSPTFPDGAPDLYLTSHGSANNRVVALGENVEMVASFYPSNQPWRGWYSAAETEPPGPITFDWTNKGRGIQSDRSRAFNANGYFSSTWAWSTSSLKFTNVKKSVKGPICCEATDANGISHGTVCCPGISIKLPDLMPPEVTPPSFPATSTNMWEVVDYKSTSAWRWGYWQRDALHYKKWAYNINGKEGFLQENLTLKPLAYDPNVAELQTGGVNYKWKIYGYDEQTQLVDIKQTTYGSDTEQTYTVSENFSGVVTCEMGYVNYPAGQTTNDPEGRPQFSKVSTVTWTINTPECWEPGVLMYKEFSENELIARPWASASQPKTSFGLYFNSLRSLGSWQGLTTNNGIQLGNGVESNRGEYTLYFSSCEKLWLPFSYMKSSDPNRVKHKADLAKYGKTGLTNNISYDGGFWDQALSETHPYWSRFSSYNYWYCLTYPDYTFLGKTLYKSDDGKSTEVVFTNGCGEQRYKINFKWRASSLAPSAGPVNQHIWLYHYTYQRYYTPSRGATPIITTTTRITGGNNFYGYVRNLGACNVYRVKKNGSVIQDWKVLDYTTTTTYLYDGHTTFTLTPDRYALYGVRIFGNLYNTQNWACCADEQVQFEFSVNPPTPNDWDNGTKVSTGFTIKHRKLPVITSHTYGWTWWYYYPRYWWGPRYYWRRPTWYWYPYSWYRPYSRIGLSRWQRAYTYYARPRTSIYRSYRISMRSNTFSQIARYR